MAKAQKQGPDGHQEDEELEGDGEEEALAGRPTSLESVGPQHSRKEKEDQRRGHHQQPHTHAYGQGEIATDALGAVLYFFPQANDFFLGNTELWGARHRGGGFTPVIILETWDEELREEMLNSLNDSIKRSNILLIYFLFILKCKIWIKSGQHICFIVHIKPKLGHKLNAALIVMPFGF